MPGRLGARRSFATQDELNDYAYHAQWCPLRQQYSADCGLAEFDAWQLASRKVSTQTEEDMQGLDSGVGRERRGTALVE